MSDYRKHIGKDPRGKALLKSEIVLPKKKKNIMMSLVSSIVGQQLSVTVARVINKRFLELYDGKEPNADQILETPHEDLRKIGLSNNKTNYIKNVARFFKDNHITSGKLAKMSDDEIIDHLTQIKGVGKWTVEMILIFTLGREDVFALDDLGIQKGMIKLHRWKEMDKKTLRAKMKKVSEKWSPYRSYACLHLWRLLDS
jgi:DNA-3-methyladenine glycosylase II